MKQKGPNLFFIAAVLLILISTLGDDPTLKMVIISFGGAILALMWVNAKSIILRIMSGLIVLGILAGWILVITGVF